MLRRLACVLLVCNSAVALSARAQSACAQLGVDCSHSNTPQHSTGSGDRSGTNSRSGPDAEDYAWENTHNGNAALERFTQGGSFSDYVDAKREFQNAFANIDRFGPAELGLCRLYEQILQHREAADACEIAMRSRFLDRKTKKWIRTVLMASIELNTRLQTNTKGYSEWTRNCELTTQPSASGSADDPSADTTQFVADCARLKTQLDAEHARLSKEIADFNTKHKR